MTASRTIRHPALNNQDLETAIARVEQDACQDHIWGMLHAFSNRIQQNGSLLVPIVEQSGTDLRTIEKLSLDKDGQSRNFELRKVELARGGMAYCAFTSWREFEKGEQSDWEVAGLEDILEKALEDETVMGLLINPWDVSVLLDKQLLQLILTPDGESPEETVPASSIYLELGSIGQQSSEALVNAAVHPFSFETESGQDMLNTLGGQIADSCPVNHLFSPFETIVLPDGSPVGHSIVHIGLPWQEDPEHAGYFASQEKSTVQMCRAVLDAAASAGLHSIAIPSAELRQAGFDADLYIPAMIVGIAAWVNEKPEYRLDVTIVCTRKDDFDAFYEFLFD